MLRKSILLLVSVVLFVGVWWLRQDSDRLNFRLPCDASGVLYANTFTDDLSLADWAQQDRRGGTIAQADGVLRLAFAEVVPPGARLFSFEPYTLCNFDYTLTAAVTGGPLNNAYGVIFRYVDPQTYYIFYVSSDGFYQVLRVLPEGWFRLSDWMPSEAIQQGVNGEQNRLRVVAEGARFRFFVNDEPLMLCVPNTPTGESTFAGECVEGSLQAEVRDDAIPYGKVGVVIETIVSGGLVAEFDDVVVRGPA